MQEKFESKQLQKERALSQRKAPRKGPGGGGAKDPRLAESSWTAQRAPECEPEAANFASQRRGQGAEARGPAKGAWTPQKRTGIPLKKSKLLSDFEKLKNKRKSKISINRKLHRQLEKEEGGLAAEKRRLRHFSQTDLSNDRAIREGLHQQNDKIAERLRARKEKSISRVARRRNGGHARGKSCVIGSVAAKEAPERRGSEEGRAESEGEGPGERDLLGQKRTGVEGLSGGRSSGGSRGKEPCRAEGAPNLSLLGIPLINNVVSFRSNSKKSPLVGEKEAKEEGEHKKSEGEEEAPKESEGDGGLEEERRSGHGSDAEATGVEQTLPEGPGTPIEREPQATGGEPEEAERTPVGEDAEGKGPAESRTSLDAEARLSPGGKEEAPLEKPKEAGPKREIPKKGTRETLLQKKQSKKRVRPGKNALQKRASALKLSNLIRNERLKSKANVRRNLEAYTSNIKEASQSAHKPSVGLS